MEDEGESASGHAPPGSSESGEALSQAPTASPPAGSSSPVRSSLLRVSIALLLLAISVCGRGDDEIDKLLRRPLSPGAVALFARQTADPRIAERLKVALSDNAAPVRTVAARVIAVGRLKGLLSSVKETLARETDANACAEEIRAFCLLGGPSADPDVLAALKRFAPRLDGSYVRLIGFRGAPAIDSYFSMLRELSLSPSDRRTFFRRVLDRDGPEFLTGAAALAFSRRAVEDWAAVLTVAADREVPLKESVLIAVLKGGEPVFRDEAAWYLAKAYRKHPPENAGEVLEAVPKEGVPSSDAELRFGPEILRRVLGKPAVEDEGWIASLRTSLHSHLDSDSHDGSLTGLLTERERNALFFRNEANRPTQERSAATAEAHGSRMHLVSGLPVGVTEDLLSVGGCRSSSLLRYYSVADVEFEPYGLPRHVSMPVSTLKADCRKTAEAIFFMTAVPDDESPRAGHVVYLALFDPDCLICNEVPAAPAGMAATGMSEEVMRVRGRVVAPKLENRVEPLYPVEARRDRQEGVSIFEAVVSSTGCVRELRVLKSSHPRLDISGMEAVARWRYRPATLNGKPVAVYLTVTTTFSLGRRSTP